MVEVVNNTTTTTTTAAQQQQQQPQPTPFLCSLCTTSKYFTRKAHLERHIRTHHAVGNPLNCHFCSREFRRSDLLKEHHIRCEFRGDRPIPVAIVGRKRRACDRCSQRKISCTGQIPCTRCINAGVVCEKTSPNDNSSSQSWQNSINSNTSRSEVDSSVPEESDEEEDGNGSDPPDLRGSIEYLLNGQSQGNVDFVQVFPVSTTPEEDDVANISNQMSVLPQTDPFGMDFEMNYDACILPDIDLNTLFGEMGYLMNIGSESNSMWDPHIFSERSSPATTTDLDIYDAHASLLRPELFKVLQSFQLIEGSMEYQRAVEAVELITGDVLQRFTNSFFRHWHKHGAIIHVPSYSPSTCATVLILAMSCIGGLYVKDQSEIRRCKNLLDIAEVYIYGRDYLKDEYELSQTRGLPSESRTYENVDWEDFEKLQAAYLMIVVQTWAGHQLAKRRIRRLRFTKVLELSRQLKLPSAHHKIHPRNPEEFMKWIRVEAAIRLQNIMLTIDCAFVIFNNSLPRISLAEIEHLDLPCAAASFAANSFAQLMSVPTPPVRGVKVMKTMRMCLTAPWATIPELNTLDFAIRSYRSKFLLTNGTITRSSRSDEARYRLLDEILEHCKKPVFRKRLEDTRTGENK
ncbi:hypothetical protein AA313_de0201984 [Arthrobotrys entomopaga]|nr:hypothetical protein AA313_de0201984 [Arthrobotrys entomopaga]